MDINFDSSGGTASVTYALRCNGTVTFATDVSWIKEMNYGGGELTFTVEENSGAQKSGTITPSVNGIECPDKAITVTQKKGSEPEPCNVDTAYTISGNVGTVYMEACDTSVSFNVPVSSVTEYVNDCQPRRIITSSVLVTVTAEGKNCGDERIVKQVQNIYTVIQREGCTDGTHTEEESGDIFNEIKDFGISLNSSSLGCEGGEVSAIPWYEYDECKMVSSYTYNCAEELIGGPDVTKVTESTGNRENLPDMASSYTFTSYNCMDIDDDISNSYTFSSEYSGFTASATVTQVCNKCGDCGCDSIGSITEYDVPSSGGSGIKIASFSNGFVKCEDSDDITFSTTTPVGDEFISNIRFSSDNTELVADISENTSTQARTQNVIMEINGDECKEFTVTQDEYICPNYRIEPNEETGPWSGGTVTFSATTV